MNAKTVFGIFYDLPKMAKVANSLKIAGFKPNQIILQEKVSEPLSVGIVVHDEFDEKMANNIISFYKPIQIGTYDFEIKDAIGLMKTFSIHAKNEISNPSPIHHHSHYHEGMNSEVQF